MPKKPDQLKKRKKKSTLKFNAPYYALYAFVFQALITFRNILDTGRCYHHLISDPAAFQNWNRTCPLKLLL